MFQRKPRILVVEDSLLLADFVCDLLRDSGTEPVGPVATVAGALRIVRDHDLDAAFLDVKVLDGTTFAVCRALQARNVPFAFLSGTKQEVLPIQFIDVPIVAKPFEWTSLQRAIVQMLKQYGPVGGDLTLGDCKT